MSRFAVESLIIAASTLLPVFPLDSAKLGKNGLVAGAGVVAAAISSDSASSRTTRCSRRVTKVAALPLASVSVNHAYREILGLHITPAEDGAGWFAFLRRPDRPALPANASGHQRRTHGLTEAISAALRRVRNAEDKGRR